MLRYEETSRDERGDGRPEGIVNFPVGHSTEECTWTGIKIRAQLATVGGRWYSRLEFESEQGSHVGDSVPANVSAVDPLIP